MALLSVKEIVEVTGGALLQGSPDERFEGYSIDSRTVQPGECFIALRGPSFNGADFVPDAVGKGAGGVLTMSQPAQLPEDQVPVILVEDTLAAMHGLAGYVRRRKNLRVIGITGSTGKTTTKELTAALLASRYSTASSAGNLNNLFGLPLSFLRMAEDADVMVCELGMSTRGEIKTLTAIAAPDVGVVTNIYPVHLEFFSSLREIALAKKEILDGMAPESTAVINRDNELVCEIASDFPGRKITFSLEKKADYRAEKIRSLGLRGSAFILEGKGRKETFSMPLSGKHQIANALAALAVASELGCPWEKMKSILAGVSPPENRGGVIRAEKGFYVMDDSYNSNPVALAEAARTLAAFECRGKRILAAGDMLELGSEAPGIHREAGKEIAGMTIDLVICVGELAASIGEGAEEGGMPGNNIYRVQSAPEAVPLLKDILEKDDILLVKGSRAVGMDRIIAGLLPEACLTSP